jgi:hypothetical protein
VSADRIPVPALVGEAAPHVPWGAPPEGYAGPRRSLILSGGGIRVCYQAGVVRALAEEGLVFGHMDATSGGAMNLAMLLSGVSPAEMCERWATLKMMDTVSLLPLEDYLRQSTAVAMGGSDALRRRAFPHLGIDPARVRAARGLTGTFNVLDYARKTVEVVEHTALDTDWLVASMSLPGLLPPVRIGGRLYLDTAFTQDANPLEAVRRGADELWLVWCLGDTDRYLGGPLHLYVQMLEMAANGALVKDFAAIAELNGRVSSGEAVAGRTRPAVLHLIRPEHPLPLDSDLYLGRVTPARLVEQGYADARRYLSRRTEAGLPFAPETLMQTTAPPTGPGITFDEVMKGPFALGAADPDAGRQQGKTDGHELALHATVSVDDVERFLADPEHTGSLMGSVDFTPWGNGLPGTGPGIFNLFSPGGDPKTKYMVYELPFSHAGEPYYLAGKKVVRDDPGFDLWKDTTTLYTVLHKGADKTGPVVGAGVLTLGVADFAKVIGAIRVTGADGAGEKAATLAKFGRFFAGELWDSYVKVAL